MKNNSFTRWSVRLLFLGFLTLGLVTFMPSKVEAQCPMCKMAAESDMKNGGKAGKGLNAGILYMFAMPYLIVGGIGLWWYRNRRRPTEDLSEEVLQDKSRLN